MRIAIVGSGISGLACAHLLDPSHEVCVFEADDRPGGHTHTVSVPTPDGPQPIDTGFIVFNDRTYPGFERLLVELGVEWDDSEMSFSVQDEASGVEYAGGRGLAGLLAHPLQLRRPGYLRMLRDIPRFNRDVTSLLAERGEAMIGGPSLGEFCAQRGYSREFVDWHILPACSAIWSARPGQMREEVPVLFLARFMANHGLLALRNRPQWRYVVGGSRRYVDALIARLRGTVLLSSAVEAIERDADGVAVRAGGQTHRFDEVIVATHADQALGLLADPSPAERRLLGSFESTPNEAVLHTDRRMLPRSRAAWASWNYHLGDGDSQTALTYHMNRLQHIKSEAEYCVTLNRTEQIDPATILSVETYEHPVFSERGLAAQAEHARLIRQRRTSFCGAYWGWGFHEDGVQSALRVCAQFDVGAPAARDRLAVAA